MEMDHVPLLLIGESGIGKSETTIELIKNENHDILTTLTAPDFPSGAQLIYDADALRNIY